MPSLCSQILKISQNMSSVAVMLGTSGAKIAGYLDHKDQIVYMIEYLQALAH